MAVKRTYSCDTPACEGFQFTHFHMSSDEPYPPCPQCGDNPNWVPGSFAMTTHKAKAVDYAQKMAEEDYGLTDMRDNTRQGESIIKAPAEMQSAERDQMIQQVAEMSRAEQARASEVQLTSGVSKDQMTWNWHGGGGTNIAAAPGAQAARNMGADPIAALHKAGKEGKVTMTAEVVARSDHQGNVKPVAEGATVRL